MAEDADLLMDLLKNIVSFGEEQALSRIFGDPSSPSLPDIVTAIEQDVARAFWQQSADNVLIQAGAALSAAQQFLAVNYQNARNEAAIAIANAADKAQETKDQNARLYGLLDLSNTAPALFGLTEQAAALESWIDDAARQDPSGMTASKAATVYLGIYLHICLIYGERGKVAPSPSAAATERDNMRDYARTAIKIMTPQVTQLVATRLSKLEYHTAMPNSHCDQMYDRWFEGFDNLCVYSGAAMNDDNKDYVAALHVAMESTRRLLFSGGQAAADATWNNVLNNGWLAGPPGAMMDRRQDYLGQTFTADWNFGKWAANSRRLLMQLDMATTGINGDAQDQWAWCANCGVLHYNDAASACPANGGGPHVCASNAASSANYGLHCDAPSAPAGAQADWRWCKNCGTLHYGAGGASVCRKGTPHASDGSSNYVLLTSGTAAGFVMQDNWRWCAKCGGMHFGAGSSVCPAGGAHANDGSADYTIAQLGFALRSFPYWGS